VQGVRFKNGDVELAGTMRLPDAGAHGGAVALVHGSGPQTRDGPFGGYLRAIAEWFAASGVVALTYDKRGCGEYCTPLAAHPLPCARCVWRARRIDADISGRAAAARRART
jgi:alpha-beta hydrolase superfamily lysophospholipase